MAERLALSIVPGTRGGRWSAHAIQTVAHEAEEVGCEAIFAGESSNEALATAR